MNLSDSRTLTLQSAVTKGYDQPMPTRALYPRFAAQRLAEALADSPAVLIHGPRQCGKTTLAQMAGRRKSYAYFTFDDQTTLEAAESDPVGFVARLPRRVILD